jgi:oligoribonuclease NrnB/cAMP/cGMP phosphodiesterase (DHH superfamily)
LNGTEVDVKRMEIEIIEGEQSFTEEWNLSKDKIDLVVYHKNCHDGMTAFAVVRKYFSENFNRTIDGVACAYDDPAPSCDKRNVLVVDFSFPLDVIVKMKGEANSFFLLDHHASAQKMLKNESGCFFDMNRSGAMLAWDFFFRNLEPPRLVNYVQDKDLWKWKLPHSREFNVAMEMMSYEPTSWDSLLREEDSVDIMIQKGIAFGEYKRFLVERITNTAVLFMWQPFSVVEGILGGKLVLSVAFVEAFLFINEVGEKLYTSEKCDVAILWRYSMKKKSYNFSLRSNTVDTSLIAKKFGGGGHPGASGFYWSRTLEEFISENRFEILNSGITA